MTNLVPTKNQLSAKELVEYENLQLMLKEVDQVLGGLPETLQELKQLYEDAVKHRASDALKLRFDIIKYLNELRGIKVEKKSNPINIVLFNYDKPNNDFNY